MSSIEKLTELFRKFPGIGPRQAERFVYFLLRSNKRYVAELSKLISSLESEVASCERCARYFERRGSATTCLLCADASRDASALMLVEKDVDLDAIEKSGSYKGLYFVLGGTVPILDKEPEKRIRASKLLDRLKENGALKEVIIATSATPDGENTAEYVKRRIASLEGNVYKITELGRGLSTGSELEYADPDTITSAFKNRG